MSHGLDIVACTPIPNRVWIERTMFGQQIVVVQHDGLPPFDYAVFNYGYGYSDNASVKASAEKLAISLGAKHPITSKVRASTGKLKEQKP